ncbi:hypothetical protein CLOSBL3_11333 [Clostridiaceae bacterium BL-3]|nr:hypothetical protein CLOSBL3_11333 [Clostridiaceae bacterium BL-3]
MILYREKYSINKESKKIKVNSTLVLLAFIFINIIQNIYQI